MNWGQYNTRHVIKHVTLKFKNGKFTIKVIKKLTCAGDLGLRYSGFKMYSTKEKKK